MENSTLLPKIGDYMMYRQSGVYRVSDIRTETFRHTEEKRYLVLVSAQDGRTQIFVPADRAQALSHLRSPLSRQEITAALREARTTVLELSQDNRTRSEQGMKILRSSDCLETLKLYRTLFLKKLKFFKEKKKFYASDEKLLSEAERLLCDECSFVFQTEPEEALTHLREALGLSDPEAK